MSEHHEKAEALVLQGNEACARGALHAGCRFFAGYPITPSTEIIEYLAAEMPRVGGCFIQMEDEIGSACAIIGARWAGKRAMTATSGPGFSLMQEAIGYAAVTETPVVIVDVQRGGPSTGQPTLSAQQDIYQARYGSHGDYEMIALAPSSVQEMYDFTQRAFALSERFRTPVILLSDEIVGHMREKITIQQAVDGPVYMDMNAPPVCHSPSADFFTGAHVLVEGQLHDEQGRRVGHIPRSSGNFIRKINEKITDHIDEIVNVESFFMEDAEVAILSYGSVARASMNAVQLARGVQGHRRKKKGDFFSNLLRRGIAGALHRDYSKLKVGLIKVNTVWPLPEEEIRRLTEGVHIVLVPEMNIGKYVREIERILPTKRVISQPKCGGELHTPNELLDLILETVGMEEDSGEAGTDE